MSVLALVGCGGISRDGYIPAIGHLRPNSVLTCDLDPLAAARAEEELTKLGVNARAVPGLESLAESDLVIVAVPPSQVRDTVTAIMSASTARTFLLEKPLGPTFGSARAMVDEVSEDAELRYMETFLHSTAYDVLVDELGTGRFGEVERLRCRVRGGTPIDLEHQWRGFRDLGGEVLHDWGIHSLGLVLHLTRAIGLAPIDLNPDIRCVDAQWTSIVDRKLLMSCLFDVTGLDVPVEVDASWSGPTRSMEDPDVVVECERGTLGLYVRKTEGSSDWTCVEIDASGRARMLASRRYPKELFVRGVAGFLADAAVASPAGRSKFDIDLGLQALRLADNAYNQAASSSSTSSA